MRSSADCSAARAPSSVALPSIARVAASSRASRSEPSARRPGSGPARARSARRWPIGARGRRRRLRARDRARRRGGGRARATRRRAGRAPCRAACRRGRPGSPGSRRAAPSAWCQGPREGPPSRRSHPRGRVPRAVSSRPSRGEAVLYGTNFTFRAFWPIHKVRAVVTRRFFRFPGRLVARTRVLPWGPR